MPKRQCHLFVIFFLCYSLPLFCRFCNFLEEADGCDLMVGDVLFVDNYATILEACLQNPLGRFLVVQVCVRRGLAPGCTAASRWRPKQGEDRLAMVPLDGSHRVQLRTRGRRKEMIY